MGFEDGFTWNCGDTNMESFISLGKEFGLEGKELMAFVKEQQEEERKRLDDERVERQREREAKKLEAEERERERQYRERELEAERKHQIVYYFTALHSCSAKFRYGNKCWSASSDAYLTHRLQRCILSAISPDL